MSGPTDWLKKFRAGDKSCLSGGNSPPVTPPRRPPLSKDVPLIERLERLEQILPSSSRRASWIRELLSELRQDATRLSTLNPGKSSARRKLDHSKSGWNGSTCQPVVKPSEPMQHYHGAFSVDNLRQMTPARFDQRKAYIYERKARLLDYYQQILERPKGASRGPDDDLVPEILEGYNRRQLELEWRQPGSDFHNQLLFGKEYKEDLTKFFEDAYGNETACGEKKMERRMMKLLRQMHKLAVLQISHQGDYPDDEIADPSSYPSHLMDAMQYKVDYYQKELLKIQQPPEEYQEAVAQFTEDAYGEETACGKQDMGKRKIQLMQQINKLAVLEKKNRGVYHDDVICDPADRPAALICAMQHKVDVYEKKLEKFRQKPVQPLPQQNKRQRLEREAAQRWNKPNPTRADYSIDLNSKSASGSWTSIFKIPKKQYVKTTGMGSPTTKPFRRTKCTHRASVMLMPQRIRELGEVRKQNLPCPTHRVRRPIGFYTSNPVSERTERKKQLLASLGHTQNPRSYLI